MLTFFHQFFLSINSFSNSLIVKVFWYFADCYLLIISFETFIITMEARNYLTDDESDNHCKNNKESDQRNVLVNLGKLVTIDGNCYDDHNIKLSDLINLETDNDLPQVDVANWNYAKRFPFILKWLDNFWFYNEIAIKNGRIVKSSLPSYISKKNIFNIKRRSKASRQVNPNPRVFAHVQNEVPWPESDLEPLLTPVLSDTIIRRVLKGMSQGKLYNIDYKKLSKIFIHRIRMDKDERAKCPLCDNKYDNKLNAIKHIESIHTNFACFCGSCGQIYLRRALCLTHECTKR
ncbi:uncharacterized protein LOC128390651 [Panonychus citri]|uniref:uncharacterized protein LOC128390651 n=1 Tax=Panonychus citri TaxID=50023 RepID=UPI002306FE2B|nr:uncharacterized protein LOC128390651 [Panonychus citri]XP_053206376.1 uncharacterized protein LOC128390651 [Panonychus citri]XP_053206377.1 uncharacterized protein LOC128390651 [Panonychus citri]